MALQSKSSFVFVRDASRKALETVPQASEFKQVRHRFSGLRAHPSPRAERCTISDDFVAKVDQGAIGAFLECFRDSICGPVFCLGFCESLSSIRRTVSVESRLSRRGVGYVGESVYSAATKNTEQRNIQCNRDRQVSQSWLFPCLKILQVTSCLRRLVCRIIPNPKMGSEDESSRYPSPSSDLETYSTKIVLRPK